MYEYLCQKSFQILSSDDPTLICAQQRALPFLTVLEDLKSIALKEFVNDIRV